MRMNSKTILLAACFIAPAVALVPTAASCAAVSAAASDQQATVDHALGTLQDLRHDKAFGNARALLQDARAVLIAPRVFKAAFFFGGQGGSAVLLVRGPHGWSDPAFYTIASASFGLQFGAQESEMILLVMSDHALQAMMRDKFTLGANAGFAVVTIGSQVSGATTAHVGADIVAWASSAGAYAGVSLDGSVIEPAHDADASYYGRPVSSSDIVLRHKVTNRAAAPLVRALGSL